MLKILGKDISFFKAFSALDIKTKKPRNTGAFVKYRTILFSEKRRK